MPLSSMLPIHTSLIRDPYSVLQCIASHRTYKPSLFDEKGVPSGHKAFGAQLGIASDLISPAKAAIDSHSNSLNMSSNDNHQGGISVGVTRVDDQFMAALQTAVLHQFVADVNDFQPGLASEDQVSTLEEGMELVSSYDDTVPSEAGQSAKESVLSDARKKLQQHRASKGTA
jgi:hypothetical protein